MIAFDNRFELGATLGEGGAKRVRVAFDRVLQRKVAIASVRNFNPEDQGLAEARAMARMRDHPRVVTIYDLVDDGSEIHLVMQFVEEGELGAFIEDHRVGLSQNDFAGITRLAVHIAEGLHHIHTHGLIHRDLKPANVLIQDNSAFVADFGLARLAQSVTGNVLAGTPAYMAPEVIQGESAGVASDLYSLGCVLYEMYCGKPVCSGATLAEAISQQVGRVPPKPDLVDHRIPRHISNVIMRLLSKDPNKRPQSAAQVAAQLSGGTDETRQASALPKVFGYREERTRLLECLDAAEQGEPQIVVIKGHAGIGKTTIARELFAVAAERNFVGCWGIGHQGASLPFQTILEALRPHNQVFSILGDEATCNLIERGGLNTADGVNPKLQLADLLNEVSSTRNVILVIDDLPLADASSREVLEALFAPIAHSSRRLILVATARSEVADRIEHWVSQARRFWNVTELNPTGLSDVAVNELVRSKGYASLPAERLRQLYRESRGNPLFVELSLLGSGDDRGMNPNVGVDDVVLAAIERLSEPSRDVLRMASCLSEPIVIDDLGLHSEITGDSFWSALADAEEAGVVRLTADQLMFSHPLFRELIYQSWGTIRRQRAHAAIAKRMATGNRSLIDLVYHQNRAGRFSDSGALAENAKQACRDAYEIGLWDTAASLAKIAIDTSGAAMLSDCELGELITSRPSHTKTSRIANAPSNTSNAQSRTTRSVATLLGWAMQCGVGWSYFPNETWAISTRRHWSASSTRWMIGKASQKPTSSTPSLT